MQCGFLEAACCCGTEAQGAIRHGLLPSLNPVVHRWNPPLLCPPVCIRSSLHQNVNFLLLQASQWYGTLQHSQQRMLEISGEQDPASPLDLVDWDESASITSSEVPGSSASLTEAIPEATGTRWIYFFLKQTQSAATACCTFLPAHRSEHRS